MTGEIIKKLGGASKLARDLGITSSAVRNWRQPERGIPWKHRQAIARMASQQGISLPADYWE